VERHLQLARNVGASRSSYFLRAETMHGLYAYLEDNPSPRRKDPEFHTMSHGESFLELMVDRFREDGPWALDEPESALSFSGSLALAGIPTDLIAEGNS
jgi:predicted ATPase